MKKNIIKIIVIVLTLIIIIGLIYTFYPKKDGKKETVQELIHLTFDDNIKNNILFSNIKIIKDDEYYFKADATNMTSNTLSITPIEITLIDDKNNQIKMTSYIGDVLESEEGKTIIVKTNKDLKDTKKIEINVQTQVLS